MIVKRPGGGLTVMSHQQQSATVPESHVEPVPSAAFLTHCYRNAIERLSRTFSQDRPLAIIIGEGKDASSFVIGSFLSSLDEGVVAVRVTEPCADARDLMRRIVRAVGFKPDDLALVDLESIFKMFLSFQRGHDRRTIVCIEEIQDSELWVLDKIRSLVELEDKGKYGLMVIISGQPRLKELLNTRPLNYVGTLAGQRISLAPFTLTDTTEYMRRRVEAAGAVTIDQRFDYHAITLIHELCAGVPDAISTLMSQCLDLADEQGVELVTTELVKRAYEILRGASVTPQADEHIETVNINGAIPLAGRLIVQLSGEDVREKVLSHGHILIGRSQLSDIRIDSPIVSRHHALISYSLDGAMLADLGSTNGTYVDGYRVKYHKLVAGETIAVGDCKIEYVLDDELQASYRDADKTQSINLPPIGK